LTPEKTVATSKPTEIPKPTAKAPAKPLAKASVKPAHAPVPHPGRTTSKSRKAVA
jgi:hypothetical protein